jgi:hypothetical protein
MRVARRRMQESGAAVDRGRFEISYLRGARLRDGTNRTDRTNRDRIHLRMAYGGRDEGTNHGLKRIPK